MNKSVTALPNSRTKLQERLQAGRITWKWPVIIVFARLIFAVLAQALVAGLYMLKGHPTPWQAAAPWWIVYGTLIDIGCFVLLARLARREGIRLFDLISFQRQRLGRGFAARSGFYPFIHHSGGSWGDNHRSINLRSNSCPGNDAALTPLGSLVQPDRLAPHLGFCRRDDLSGLCFTPARGHSQDAPGWPSSLWALGGRYNIVPCH